MKPRTFFRSFDLLFVHIYRQNGKSDYNESLWLIIRVAGSSEKSGKFLKFEHFSDFLLTFWFFLNLELRCLGSTALLVKGNTIIFLTILLQIPMLKRFLVVEIRVIRLLKHTGNRISQCGNGNFSFLRFNRYFYLKQNW